MEAALPGAIARFHVPSGKNHCISTCSVQLTIASCAERSTCWYSPVARAVRTAARAHTAA